MSRIHPVNFRFTEPKNKRLLETVRQEYSRIPNFFLGLANSPATLDGFLKFKEALEEGDLSYELQEKIALTVAALNDCKYSAAAHREVMKNFDIPEEEFFLNLKGESMKEKDQVALEFVKKLVDKRGMVSDEDFKTIKRAGYYNGQIIQILAEVCLNMFTNYFNHLGQTDLDYPEIVQLKS